MRGLPVVGGVVDGIVGGAGGIVGGAGNGGSPVDGAGGETATVTVTEKYCPPTGTVTSNGQCNTGKIQCCDKVTKVKDTGSDILSGLLNIGLVLDDLVGIQCSPIDVIAVGSGSSCTGQVACCKDDTFNGVVNIACSPVNVSL
ncbi:fungal hydrophobin-domain-containing protein [Schizophyllum amplum]|uniref:Hydrophobin n=1 Tax=Schizophyllum amplum TaxID=97359 RepID=A0A550BV36_9AGAR|nr:fungal hydrophobin-domain-containing protein [Auriculariopsis ampla]TRM59319.1 fungal hydrophobin-domain-containing protein [Auriculariopsis ampla]